MKRSQTQKALRNDWNTSDLFRVTESPSSTFIKSSIPEEEATIINNYKNSIKRSSTMKAIAEAREKFGKNS